MVWDFIFIDSVGAVTAVTHTHTHTVYKPQPKHGPWWSFHIFKRISQSSWSGWFVTLQHIWHFLRGFGRNTAVPIVSKNKRPQAHPELSYEGCWEWMLLVVSLRWWGQEQMLSTQGSPAAHYYAQWGRQLSCVARDIAKSKNRWASCNHLGMVAVGWPRMAAQGLRLHRKDQHSKASGLAKT